jgi:hypothetical protein
MTYGIVKAKSNAVIPGKVAEVRVGDPQPVFYFYFAEKAAGLDSSGGYFAQNISNPNQFALIRLAVDKNSRQAEIGEFSMWGSQSGNNSKDIVLFKSERVKPGLYKVTLESPHEGWRILFYDRPRRCRSGSSIERLRFWRQ